MFTSYSLCNLLFISRITFFKTMPYVGTTFYERTLFMVMAICVIVYCAIRCLKSLDGWCDDCSSDAVVPLQSTEQDKKGQQESRPNAVEVVNMEDEEN